MRLRYSASACFFLVSAVVRPQEFTIPDANFRDWLELAVPAAVNGDTLYTEHPDVLALDTLIVGDNCVNCQPEEPASISGIEHFVNLRFLAISECLLGHIQGLPNGIRELHMNYIPNLLSVDHWPDSARYISAKHDYYWDGPSNLAPIPELPPYLEYLDLYAQLLTELPPVPPSLRELRMERNQLSAVPILPNELRHLNLRNSLIPAFPVFPDSLRYLNIGGYASLTSIAPFPPFLQEFQCTYAPALTVVPALPPTLQVLNTTGTNIACYPFVPPTVTDWNVATSLACIPNLPPFLAAGNAGTKPICNLINSGCPVTAAATGTLFLDEDGDGELDDGEPPLPQAWVVAEPGNNLGGSDATGRYFLPLEIGTFTVTGGEVPWFTQTTAPQEVTITEPFEVDSLVHLGFQITPGMVDLTTDLFRISGPPRPGFQHRVRVKVTNTGTQVTGGTLTFQFDAGSEWVGATLTPTTQSGNSATWTFSLLQPGHAVVADVTLFTPSDTPLGTDLEHHATVVCTDVDVQPGNDARTLVQEVRGSYDPNDKTVEPATMRPAQVLNGEHLTYTIRFQNTGTFLAERVVITDTLPEDLQVNSLRLLDASHANTWFVDAGVLHVVFDGIMLPDSISDEPGSHGHVRFSILPAADLAPGAVVLNAANIYFDFNPPVITPPSVFAVEVNTGLNDGRDGLLLITPVPADDEVVIMASRPIRTCSVLATDGKEVMRSTTAALDISSLRSGAFTVIATTDDGQRLIGRFIKR